MDQLPDEPTTPAPPPKAAGSATYRGLCALVDAARFPMRGDGYDPGAVDAFLDDVAARLGSAGEQIAREESAARRDADHLRADAGRHAALIRLQARAEADEILQDARAQAGALVGATGRTGFAGGRARPPDDGGVEDRVVAVALDAIGAIAEMAGSFAPAPERSRVGHFVSGVVVPRRRTDDVDRAPSVPDDVGPLTLDPAAITAQPHRTIDGRDPGPAGPPRS